MGIRYDLNTFQQQLTPHTRLTFDANVWLYFMSPSILNHHETITKPYQQFVKWCFMKQVPIYLFYLTLSEIVNRWLSEEFKIILPHYQQEHQKKPYKGVKQGTVSEFKKVVFRNDPIYGAALKKLRKNFVTKIRNRQVILLQDDFHEFDSSLNGILDDHPLHDLNDSFLAEQCVKHQLAIVTHDADFSAHLPRIDIITNNSNLTLTLPVAP